MARLPYVVPYDPDFLGDGFRVALPEPRCRGGLHRSGVPIDYIHASLVLHRDRRTALFTAHNVDAARRRSVPRDDRWEYDPRVEHASQTGPTAYANNVWDRGHLVRRADVAWGDTVERAQDASDATFYFTNAAPQHNLFNTEEWLRLEDWVLTAAAGVSPRLCVLAGPLYTTRDLVDAGVRIPSAFWKVVVLRDPTADGADLAALGFVMKQNELWTHWNGGAMADFETFQVGIPEIGGYTGLEFGELALLDEFSWRQPRFRDRARMRPVRIAGPGDIRFSGERRRARGIRALQVAPAERQPAGAAPAAPLEPAVQVAPVASGAPGAHGRSPIRPSAVAAPGAGAAFLATGAPVVSVAPAARGARAAGAAGARRRSCGCGKGATDLQDQVSGLARQVQALREVLDDTLLDQPFVRTEATDDLDDRFRTREDALRRYARIVGGTITATDEFPDCACIGGDGDWFCSGVLVHPRVVVTAAHCAPQIDRVFLGGRSLTLIGSQGEVVPVERVHVHPDYEPSLVPSHDLAVLVLAQEAAATPVAIAGSDEVDAQDDVMLVGFGYEHPTEDIGFGTKRKVSVPMTTLEGMTPPEISVLESVHGFASGFELHAGRKQLGKDSCNGDSGGPCYVGGPDGFRLAAVTSRASWSADLRCGDGGIYTRVAPYLSWIHQVTGGLVGGEADPVPVADGTEAGCLYVSAALPNPAGGDAGREWIEVTNAGSLPLDLDEYVLSDAQGGELALSGALAAGATRRVVLPASSRVKLANAGDEILLRRNGSVLHRVGYPHAGAGEVLAFDRPCTAGTPSSSALADADPC